MYDEVDWRDGRRAQVKCLGASMKHLKPGDRVQLAPTQLSSIGSAFLEAPSDFQIAMRDGTFITVVSGVLQSWDGLRRPTLPVVDNRGAEWDGEPSSAAPVIP